MLSIVPEECENEVDDSTDDKIEQTEQSEAEDDQIRDMTKQFDHLCPTVTVTNPVQNNVSTYFPCFFFFVPGILI